MRSRNESIGHIAFVHGRVGVAQCNKDPSPRSLEQLGRLPPHGVFPPPRRGPEGLGLVAAADVARQMESIASNLLLGAKC